MWRRYHDQQCYAVLTNEAGGILDDLIITRLAADKFMLVVNAACKQADIRYLEQQLVRVRLSIKISRLYLLYRGRLPHRYCKV